MTNTKQGKMMNKMKIASLTVVMIVLVGCAPLASIENAASKLNAAIPAPNDVGYIAKNAIKTGCTSRMTAAECSQVRNMKLVDMFVYKAHHNKSRVLSMPINTTNRNEAKKWIETNEYLLGKTKSAYSRKQLQSIEPIMDAIEDRFFPNM